MFSEVTKNPWVRAVGGLLALAIVLAVLSWLRFVLIPLFFAFIVAYICHPIVDFVERRRVPRLVAVLLLVVLVAVAGIVLPVTAVTVVILDAQDFVQDVGRSVDGQWLNKAIDRLPLEELVRAMGWAPDEVEKSKSMTLEEWAALPPEGSFNAREVLARRVGELIENNAAQFVRTHGRQLADVGQTASTSVVRFFSLIGNAIVGVVLFVGNLALFAFVTVYLLKDYEEIRKGANSLIPPRYRAKVGDVMGQIDTQLRAFFRGQLIVCTCLGFMYGVGFWLAGVPFALALGIFGGFASLVPYAGPVLTMFPAVILSLLQVASPWTFLGILITNASAQFLEGNFLTPKVVGDQVGLNPVWVILSLLVFSNALGFFGLLCAIPLAAVAKVLVVEALDYYRASSLFEGEDSADEASPPESG